jgi:uncharacterized protein (DUF58 family)
MKTTIVAILSLAALLFLYSCSKNNQAPKITFTNNTTEGQANANGEFTITGTLVSDVNLEKVTLTKEGQTSPFLIDDSEAKNKNSYSFSYLVTGINSNTTIILDAYDQEDGKTTARFVIRK